MRFFGFMPLRITGFLFGIAQRNCRGNSTGASMVRSWNVRYRIPGIAQGKVIASAGKTPTSQ
jgi:cobalamin biosynthesis protein CobD/CbiB